MPSSEHLLDEVKSWVKVNVSPARLRHIEGVVSTTQWLARRYGVSIEKAVLAAWLHDAAKEMTPVAQHRLMKKAWIPWDDGEKRTPELRHSKAAAALAVRKWFVRHPDVLKAVAHHTLGSPKMGALEKVLFVADFIEPGRRFKGVELVRRAAKRSLDEAVLCKISLTLAYLMVERVPIHSTLIATYNSLLRRN